MRRPIASKCSNGLPRSTSETFAPAFASSLAACSRKVFVYSSARSQNMVRQKPILSWLIEMLARDYRCKACNRGSKQSEVLDRASEKPHRVEGGGILLHALCAHFAVARLIADAAAERGWTNYRPDSLGAKGQRHHEI